VNAAANDSVNKVWLAEHGRRTEARLVVVLAPRDSITEQHQRALTDSIDRGMAEVSRLTGGRQPQWQGPRERRITYYLSPGTFVAHATIDGGVFISIQRSLNGRASCLHEGAHTLLVPTLPDTPYAETAEQRAARMQRQPHWLMEGFADVLALRASAATGVPEVDLSQRFSRASSMKAGGRASNGSWVSPWRSSTPLAAAHQAVIVLPTATEVPGSWCPLALLNR
jgi:hypothetical protein